MSKTVKHYSETKEDPYCNYSHEHFRTAIHGKMLNDAKERIRHLEAENGALKAQLGQRGQVGHHELIVDLVGAIRSGEEWGVPAPGAQATDQTKTGRQKPHGTEPRGGNWRARKAVDRLAKKVRAAMDVFDADYVRFADDTQGVDVGNKGPKDRCWTRGCMRYSRWFVDECPGCGKPATKPLPPQSEKSDEAGAA